MKAVENSSQSKQVRVEGVVSPVLVYNAGEPTERGVYACRVPTEWDPKFHEDIFLSWINQRWKYLGSDQYCRRGVIGWIGPLQRTRG